MKKKFFIFFCLSLFSNIGFTQVVKPISLDSLPTELYFFNEHDNHLKIDSNKSFIDTSNSDLLNQIPVFFNHELNLGNFGTPQFSLVHQKFEQPLGFVGQFDFLNRFRYSGKTYKTLTSNKAYTVFQYLNGTSEEERFNVLHAQPIKEFGLIGFDYNSLTSTGFYSRQRTQHRNFALFGNYLNPNSHYSGSYKFFFNSATILENGGITQASDLGAGEFGTEFIPISIDQARNGSQNRSLYVFQKFSFGRKERIDMDSVFIASDSIDLDSVRFTNRKGDFELYVFHEGIVNDKKFDFALIRQNLSEVRSIYKHFFTNQNVGLAFNQLGFRNLFANGKVSFEYQNGNVASFIKSEPYQNFLFKLSGDVSVSRFIKVGINTERVMTGFNQGDFKQDLWGSLQSKNFKLVVTGKIQETSAPFIYRSFYSSDSISWENTFSKELVSAYQVKASFFDQVHLSFENGNHQSLLYFDTLGLPQQLSEGINYFKLNFKGDIDFWKFTWTPNVTFQQYSSEVFPMPNWVIFNRISIGGWLFDNHMKADFGVDLFFTDGFDGYSYSPLTRQFHLNQTHTRLGNYPFVDVFFTAKVKTATFFLRASHLNAGFSGNDYFTSALYPYHPFSFRIGFKWMFLY